MYPVRWVLILGRCQVGWAFFTTEPLLKALLSSFKYVKLFSFCSTWSQGKDTLIQNFVDHVWFVETIVFL